MHSRLPPKKTLSIASSSIYPTDARIHKSICETPQAKGLQSYKKKRLNTHVLTFGMLWLPWKLNVDRIYALTVTLSLIRFPKQLAGCGFKKWQTCNSPPHGYWEICRMHYHIIKSKITFVMFLIYLTCYYLCSMIGDIIFC